MSKTLKHPPSPHQLRRQERRRKLWQATQPPPLDYPQREPEPWKVLG
jgi:hypothetical protein